MAKRTSTKDNLTKIKGIGPKIQSLLNAKGIMTFKNLAAAKMSKLEAILDEAGPRFNLAEPANWILEAKELAKSSTAAKPKTSTKPKTTMKSKAESKPKTSTKSKTTTKPKAESKPKNSTKPKTTAKPKAESEPKTSTKPKTTTKPKTESKPKTSTKPKTQKKPKTSTKPKTSKPKSKPKASTRPKTSEDASKIKVGELDLPRFRKIMRELKDNAEGLTKMTVRKYRKQAKKDAEKLLRGMKRDLRRWTRLLEKGDLTTEDFEFLVKSQVASAKMSALESSGLAAIRLEAYRSSMFNMIIDTIFGLALKALA